MFRTENSVGMLKSIAMIAGLAILLWSLGLPSLRLADAANIVDVSDVISDSAPGASADHTITFEIPATGAAVADGTTIVIDFNGFTSAGVTFADIDLSGDTFGAMTIAADCAGAEHVGAAFASEVLTMTLCGDGGEFVNGEVVTLLIGDNATGGSGNTQLVNPATEGSFDIDLTSVGAEDSGTTKVVILTAVTVSATVDTIFTFAVAGTAANTELSAGGATTTGVAASTSVAFGKLDALVATSSAHLLTVNTNANTGYVVTVQVDGALESSTGADIDGVAGGDTPAAWSSPTSPVIGSDETYGWWGVSSDDTAITARGTQFVAGQFIAASTTPRAVMGNVGPVNGEGVGVGTTTIGFKVEISALQEAGDDYSAILTYVATPTF